MCNFFLNSNNLRPNSYPSYMDIFEFKIQTNFFIYLEIDDNH